MKTHALFLLALLLIAFGISRACSILYYVDSKTGKIYAVNNEDFWYDVDAYIQITPKSKNKFARLWYGWDNFAQGGINEKGLFFDVAVTPEQKKIKGYKVPHYNLGDKMLAKCATVNDALLLLDEKKIALTKSHILLGDKTGNAVIIEWVDGEKKLHRISNNRLIATNYLLSKPEAGNYPCPRYQSIEKKILEMEALGNQTSLLKIGNTFSKAGQPPREIQDGRIGGTLYTSFINISDAQFVLSYKLSNKNIIKLDLNTEFSKPKPQKISLKNNKWFP